ncbi:hypothetical protein [Citrobacter werkmanii]|uniref:hypothetical protein n=1 Tax=Citrobacter werkmanii TaxID=67827 RepID=UPI001576F34B|nr:hypothetical protein [Citrobacter werkmanii]NTY83992.1 hypothetical protein [Citrobacter werkmanii]
MINNPSVTLSADDITSVLNDSKNKFLNKIIPFLERGVSNNRELLEFQRAGNEYFNSAVSLIQRIQLNQLDNNKSFAISIVGDCRAVLESYLFFQDKMAELISELNLNPDDYILYSQDSLSNLQRIVKKYSKSKVYKPIYEEFKKRNLPVDGFNIGTPMNWKKIITAVFGIVFFVTFLTIALIIKDLSPFAEKLLTSLYFTGAAIVLAPFVADKITVNGKAAFRGSEFTVSAVGGLAVLILSFIIQNI